MGKYDNQKTPQLRRVLKVARGGIEPPTQGFSVLWWLIPSSL